MRHLKGSFLLLIVGCGCLWACAPREPTFEEQGGLRITYRMNVDELPPSALHNPVPTQQRLIPVLKSRASTVLDVERAAVRTKGTTEVVVELPGFTDEERARQVLTNPAKLEIFWARTVTTQWDQLRLYTDLSHEVADGGPVVPFVRNRGDGDTLKPGDPGYLKIIESWGEPLLDANDLASAHAWPAGTWLQPHFFFTDSGVEKLTRWSTQHLGRGEKLAFVLDGVVLNIAAVREDAILSDSAYIDGQFDQDYVRRLVETLNSGALPVGLTEQSLESVAPKR